MIEQLSYFWIIAIVIDLMLGSLCFYIIAKNPNKTDTDGLFWWFGWFAYLDAIALFFNFTLGIDSFWSYHQIGILIDTAINAGLIAYIYKVTRK